MTQDGKTKKIFDGRYEILSIVGRGACSVVYHARHAAPPVSNIALKVLLNKNGERANTDRLRKEALAMVSSRHRYVIRLDDFHSVGELCYLSMEYAPESDLRKFAARLDGKLELPQIERFMLQASEALGFIHRAGIIHRDIKPDNILVMNENEIRLGDFGVAVLPGEESSLEELQRGVGTMDYMAPEVLNGTRYDQRSDVYALGVTFYELFTRKHPFAGASLMQQLEVRKDGAFPDITSISPAIPRYLSQVIMRAMSFDHERRFPTGREMLQAILVGKSEAEKQRAKPAAMPQSPPPAAPPVKAPRVESKTSAPAPVPSEFIKEKTPPRVEVKTPPSDRSQEVKKPLMPLTPRKPAVGNISKATSEQQPRVEETPDTADHKESVQEPVSGERVRKRTSTHEGVQALAMQSPSLPGIGLKTPVIASGPGGVRINEPQRRETVSVPSTQIGAARELSPGKPTVKISSEQRPGALASNALLGENTPSDDADRAPTVGFAGNTAQMQVLQPTAAPDAIQGIQGRFKKVPPPVPGERLEKFREKFITPALSTAREIKIDAATRKLLCFGVLAIAVVVVGMKFYFGQGTEPAAVAKHKNASSIAPRLGDITSAGIPAVQSDAALQFPNLPAGMYVGKISGFIPSKDIPLTIISFPSKHSLSFLLGLPGWTPALVAVPASTAKDDTTPIRVASNGIILEFTGQILDGELDGYFRNLVSGDEGSWEAAPIRRAGGGK